MNKIILSLEQVDELIRENRYKVDSKKKFLSRCIDGRYKNQVKSQKSKVKSSSQNLKVKEQLPALAFPGADVGELALILATGNSYGFEVNMKKVLRSLIDVVGGEKNFRLHTDSHADPKVKAGGCGHWKQINLDPKAYFLETNQVDSIKKNLNIGKSVTLEGEHLEGAVLILKGNWGVYPQAHLETDHGKRLVEVFIYHQSLVDERHKVLVSTLLRQKAVVFKDGEDEEWLYQALSETSDVHLMETAKRLAKGLPIYEVKFEDDGQFMIKEQGVV